MNGVTATFWSLPVLGALAFGAVIGWYVYYINRFRKDASAGDITTIVSALGGATITAIFKSELLFGAYSLGLGLGFFGYFAILILLVRLSPNFNRDFFLDGRHKKLADDEERQPEQRPMLMEVLRASKEEESFYEST